MLGRCEGWASRCWSCGHTWGCSPMPGQRRGTALSRWGGLCSAPALQLLAVISVSCCPPAAQCFTFSCGQLGAVAEPEQCVHPVPAASVCFGRVTPLVPACCSGRSVPFAGGLEPSYCCWCRRGGGRAALQRGMPAGSRAPGKGTAWGTPREGWPPAPGAPCERPWERQRSAAL